MSDGDVPLALEGISKRFGPTRALDDASILVRRGTIHALLGENGAGKTTLMRIAFGLIQPDAGRICLDGRTVRFVSPKEAIRSGIGMVHQHFTIVQAMTVAENVALGGHGRFDARAIGDLVRRLGATTGMALDPDARAGELGVAAQQQLEILKALARDARVLILDEPTAALPPGEANRLLQRLRELAAHELAIVLITHKLRDALAVADDVTVLRRGRVVLAARAADVDESVLAGEMLGNGWTPVPRTSDTVTRPARSGVPVLRAEGISIRDERRVLRVRGATVEVQAGEIVGIAGVEGAGVRELLRGFAGHLAIDEGTLHRPDRTGFIPEDRHREALALSLSVTENIALRGASARRGVIRWRAFQTLTSNLIASYDIRTPALDAAVEALSGGNQQRLVLARELSHNPDLLIAENPTRGLDPRATAAVHARFRAARDEGMAIVVYSSDLDELMLLADRVFAMHAGMLIATLPDREMIGRVMLGGGSIPGETGDTVRVT